MNTQNFHIITVKYLGATNFSGSRVKMISDRFQESKTIGFDHRFDNTLEIAEDWLSNHGFNIIGHGEGKDCYYVITDTFVGFKEAIAVNKAIKNNRQPA